MTITLPIAADFSPEINERERDMRAKWAAKLAERTSFRRPGYRLCIAELLLLVSAKTDSIIGLCRIEDIMPRLGWEPSVDDASASTCEAQRIVYTKLPPAPPPISRAGGASSSHLPTAEGHATAPKLPVPESLRGTGRAREGLSGADQRPTVCGPAAAAPKPRRASASRAALTGASVASARGAG